MKQWELKNNSVVELPDGSTATFIKMDGMYAHWDQEGQLKIGNFEAFEKTDIGYKVVVSKTIREKKQSSQQSSDSSDSPKQSLEPQEE